MAQLDEKTKIWMMSPEGIKGLWDRIDRVNQELSMMWNWLAEMSVALETPSTVGPPTTASPTKAYPWVAEAPVSTDPRIQPSSQSDPPTTDAGLAAQPSECAHEMASGMSAWMWLTEGYRWCVQCGALKCGELTRVPAVTPVSSTSQRPASPSSAATSPEASAVSALPEHLTEVQPWT